MSRSVIPAFAVGLVVLAGCSHPPASTKVNDMSVGGGGSDGPGAAGNDLAGGSDGGNGGGADGGGGGSSNNDVFRVMIENFDSNVDGANNFIVQYHFRSGCTRTMIGPCTVLECKATTPPMSVPSAGRIDVTGGRIPLVDIPDVYGHYSLELNTAYAWSAGQMLTWSAPGAMVPAFNETLAAPAIMRLTQPATPPATIDRAAPWTLQWTPGPAGQLVRATIDQTTQTSGVALDCRLPLEAGSGAIPAAALQRLAAGAASLLVEVVSSKLIAGATVDTELIAASWVSDGNGGGYLGSPTMK